MWITIIVLLFHIAGLLSSINAIMTARTSQGAIAWAVPLNTFPYIAVPAYWVLGRNRFQGYTAARLSTDTEVQKELKYIFDAFMLSIILFILSFSLTILNQLKTN